MPLPVWVLPKRTQKKEKYPGGKVPVTHDTDFPCKCIISDLGTENERPVFLENAEDEHA